MTSTHQDPRGRAVADFFDAESARYDRAYERSGADGRALRRRLEVALRLLGDGPGDVLDAGMGGGRLCVELDRRGWNVAGIDIASGMVEFARARLPHARERLIQASIDDLPFADESFDAVVATGVLEFMGADLRRAVEELARVLRPGGIAVVSFPNHRAPLLVWRGRVLYPAVRAIKRRVRIGNPPPPDAPILPLAALRDALAAVGLDIELTEALSVRPVPSKLAERLERSNSMLARLLATQIVIRARKR